jgi:hypothetical protein
MIPRLKVIMKKFQPEAGTVSSENSAPQEDPSWT